MDRKTILYQLYRWSFWTICTTWGRWKDITYNCTCEYKMIEVHRCAGEKMAYFVLHYHCNCPTYKTRRTLLSLLNTFCITVLEGCLQTVVFLTHSGRHEIFMAFIHITFSYSASRTAGLWCRFIALCVGACLDLCTLLLITVYCKLNNVHNTFLVSIESWNECT